MAMVLAEAMGPAGWEVLGTDISARVLERARRGLYPMTRTEHIPPALLKRHCEQRLAEAKMKVEKIVFSADGSVATQPADLG